MEFIETLRLIVFVLLFSIIGLNFTIYKQFKMSPKYSSDLKYINSIRFFLVSSICLLLSQFFVDIIFNIKFNINLSSVSVKNMDLISHSILLLFSVIFGITSIVLMINDRSRFSRYNIRMSSFLISSIIILFYPVLLEKLDNEFISIFSYILSSKFKISFLIKGLYVFLSLFITLQYFSQVIIISTEEKRKLKEQLINIEGLHQAYNILSLITAFILTLIISGSDLKIVGASAAAIGIGISFSLKELITNFVSGILLMWDKSIKQNNVISIENYVTDQGGTPYGWIEKVTLRYTVIKDRNDINLLIPNTIMIANPIINWTQDGNKVRIKLDIGISYDSDIDLATTIIKRVAGKEIRVLNDPGPSVNIMELGESSVNLQLRFYIEDAEKGIRNIKSAIYKSILKNFREESDKIRIPFPQRDIHIVKSTLPPDDTDTISTRKRTT